MKHEEWETLYPGRVVSEDANGNKVIEGAVIRQLPRPVMKHKVATLEGAQLDAAVFLANGGGSVGYLVWDHEGRKTEVPVKPTEDWHWTGPMLIEREHIALIGPGPTWDAYVGGYNTYDGIDSQNDAGHAFDAPTPLIAACRAFVASKFGEEVELP